jgi:Chaperone of endosialidase/Collagen triple helix repeat (20 copies)
MTQTQNYYKTIVKNLATKSLVFWLSSAITVSGLAATVAVTVYKCPIGSYLNQNYELEIFQECIITEGFTVKELKGRLANLGKNISTQGILYQNEKLVFPDGKTLDLKDIQLKDSKINDLTITDDKIVIAKTGGETNSGITLQDLNQAINNTNLDPTGQTQTLSISGDTLAISNGNFVKLPSSTQNFITNVQNNINQVSAVSSSSASTISSVTLSSSQSSVVSQSSNNNQAIVIVGGGNNTISNSSSSQSSAISTSSISSTTAATIGGFNIATNSSGLPINLNSNETLQINSGANLRSTIDSTNKKITLAVVDTPTFTDLTVTGNTNLNGNISFGQLNDSTPTSNANNFLGFNNSGNLVKVAPAIGLQGVQGLQGIQGLVGLTGAMGQTGPQGVQGLTGATGPKGDTGTQGLQGLVGAIGAAGIQGLTGAIGATGLQGVIGLSGATGLTGVQGIQGPKGDKGDTGNTGLTGATGVQGIQGLTGLTGLQGVQGIQGQIGLTGAAGNNGAVGATGAQGLVGATGMQGIQGLTGTTGLTGAVGSTGAVGAQGQQGIQGEIGLPGAQGIQGIQGSQGLKGDTGDQGIQGLIGLNGNVGATGAQGIQGIAGVANIQTANNGLTLSLGNLQLGGTLTSPTGIITSAFNTLSLTGLQAGLPTDKVLVQDGSGVIKTTTLNSSPISLGTSHNLLATGYNGGNKAGANIGLYVINSNFFGQNAGSNLSYSFDFYNSNSNFFGFEAGQDSPYASESNFFGNQAGKNAYQAGGSNFLGNSAGLGSIFGSNSNFFGWNSGQNATNANNSIFIGRNSGKYDTVNNAANGTSILIGDDTNTGGFSNSIAVGKSAVNTKSNQFKIAPAYNNLSIGGIEYVVPNAQATTAGQVLTNNGSGALSWTTPSAGSALTAGSGINISGNTISTTCNGDWTGGMGTGNPLCIGGNDGGPANPTIIGLKNGAFSYGLFIKSANGNNLGLFNYGTESQKQFNINPQYDSGGNYVGALANDSGLTLSQLSNATPLSTATNYLGFDNAGKVVKVATPSGGSSYTTSNGLTLSGSNLQLGGTLTSPTNITTTAVNTLSLTGLQAGLLTDKVLVQDANGILKTLNSSLIGKDSLQSAYDFTGNGAGNIINLFDSKPININSTSNFANFFTTALELKNYDTSYQSGTNLAFRGAYNTYAINSSRNLTISTSSQDLLTLLSGSTVINAATGTKITDGNNNSSGLFLISMNNSTPASTATNYLGYDSTGKVVKVATPSAGICTTCFVNGGNSFGGLTSIGTIDNNSFSVITNNIEKIKILSTVDANNNILTITGGDALINGITAGNRNKVKTTAFGEGALNVVGNSSFFGSNLMASAFGYRALANNSTAYGNSAFGSEALTSSNGGNANSAFGTMALFSSTSGTSNNAFGFQSLYSNTTGAFNTSMGVSSLFNNISGSGNNAFGNSSLRQNTIGSGNNAIGENSLLSNTTGSNNSVVGNALYNNISGNQNIAFGYLAGNNLTAGDNNIALGSNTKFAVSTNSNQLNIANNIFGTGLSGSVTAPAGFIGIGTAAPSARLEIASGTANTSGLKFTSLTAASPTSTGQSIGVDASGNVVTIAASNSGWGLTGNAGTTASNYLGTSDSQPLVFKTSNADRGRFDTNGSFVINKGVSNPVLGSDFTVINNINGFASSEVRGGSTGGGAIQKFVNDTGYQFTIGAGGSTNASFANGSFVIRDQNVSQNRLVVAPNGNVGVGEYTSIMPTNKLTVEDLTTANVAKFNGSGSTQCTIVTGTGLTCSSDERLKAGIITGAGLEQINQLRGVQYNWKNGGSLQNGFIAQEVAGVIPNAVTTDSNGYLSLNQNAILPVAVNAIKELDVKVKDLENKVAISTVANTSTNNTSTMFNQITTFVSDIVIKGTAWIQDLVVKGSTIFQGRVEFQDKDIAGVATIQPNTKEIEVRYTKPYNFTPVVNITSLGHRIIGNLKSSNPSSFVIEIENSANNNLKFNWTAINVRGEELIATVSSSSSLVISSSSSVSSISSTIATSSTPSETQTSSSVGSSSIESNSESSVSIQSSI